MPTELTPPPTTSPNATTTTTEVAPKTDVQVSDAAPKDSAKTADPMRDVFTPAAKPAAPAAAAPAKDAKDKPAEGADKGKEKPADTAAAPAGEKKVAGAKKPDGDNSVITQIRNAEKAAKNEAAEWRGKYEELQKKGGGDTSALTKTVEELQKENTRLQGEVGALNYRKHPDFVNKHEKPFQDAQKSAKNIIESLKVITGKDADGNDIVRRADWNKDFFSITSTVTGNTPAEIRANAIDQIEAKFGKYADQAMNQFDKLYELNEKRNEALHEYSQKSGEIEAQNRSKQIQMKENRDRAFDVAFKDIAEQNQELFGERADDTEGNELVKKMEAFIDPVFHAPETLAPEEFVARLASIKHRVRTYPRLQRDLATARDEIAELTARINGTEESSNGKTRKTGEEITGQDPDENNKQEMQKAWA